MAAERFLGKHIEIHALNAARGAGKTTSDDFVAKTDRLENLSTLVALQRGDAHLGHHFKHALGDALAIGIDQIVIFLGNGIIVFVVGTDVDGRMEAPFTRFVSLRARLGALQQAFAASVPERFKRQIGIDRVGTVANQQAMMVNLSRLASLDDDPDSSSLRAANQMMMHCAGRQQRTEGNSITANIAVGQYDDGIPAVDRHLGFGTDAVER